MRVILHAAISANGFIATEDGSEDFLSHEHWKLFCSYAKKYPCFIVGRKAYDVVSQWKEYTFDDVPAKLKIVVSHKPHQRVLPYVSAKSPRDALSKARKAGFKTVLVVGGAGLYSSFLAANLVDEIVLSVEPTVLGKGIPLIASWKGERKLSLQKTRRLPGGIIQFIYSVKRT